MTWDEAIEQVVSEGAIRIWKTSHGWALAYRLRKNSWEARSIVRISAEDWNLANSLVGGNNRKPSHGWQPVPRVHHRAALIAHPYAKRNRGYYAGLAARCETCKQTKPAWAFERDAGSEQGFRTWECNDCAAERAGEMGRYRSAVRVGDYVRRETHASKPPVEGDI
ncbi:MAG: hypothetical protein HYZ26_02830 [Chloroflexi bacterium]|nr:hypothetical protein [Chloroflexota bacterium]